MTLDVSVKTMDHTMGENGLVPSKLELEALPYFVMITRTKRTKSGN